MTLAHVEVVRSINSAADVNKRSGILWERCRYAVS